MKRLMLLRHAKAVPGEAALADVARPLAPRGEQDARRVAERLRRHDMVPAAILASSAARTVRTAQIVADCLGIARACIMPDPNLYLADPAAILERIAGADSALESLLVVGHNPGLTELVHRLCPAFELDDLPTAAVVAFDHATAQNWADVGTPELRLRYFDYPKNAREPFTTR